DAGFASLPDQPAIPDAVLEQGLPLEFVVESTDVDNETPDQNFDNFGLIVAYTESWGRIHFVAFEQYFRYSVDNYQISWSVYDNDPNFYNQVNPADPQSPEFAQGKGLGAVYDYDLARFVYDPELGQEHNLGGYSLMGGVNYDYALEMYQSYIGLQDQNYYSIAPATVTAISVESLYEYFAYNQNESYLGLDTEQIYAIDSQLDNSVFYYVDADGKIDVLEMPPSAGKSTLEIVMLALSIAQVVIGTVLICTGVGAGVGVSLVIGGVLGMVSYFASEEIGKIIGGGQTISTGWGAFFIGMQIFKMGTAGMILGSVCMIVGGATILFGAADIGEGLFGYNFIKQWTGLSDEAYGWVELGLNIASTLLAIGGNLYKNAWTKAQTNNPNFCFVAGTQVLTQDPHGNTVPKSIEQIQVGDLVLSQNLQTGKTELKPVVQTFTSTHNEVIRVTTSAQPSATNTSMQTARNMQGQFNNQSPASQSQLANKGNAITQGQPLLVDGDGHPSFKNDQNLRANGQTQPANNHQSQTLTASLDHNFYTQNRGWLTAKDLRAGDILVQVNGQTVIVEQVQHTILENTETLYNFEVEDNHNYFVGQGVNTPMTEYVLVHNDCIGGADGSTGEYNKGNYRRKYLKEYNNGVNPGKEINVHHRIPKEFADEMKLLDINVHDPKYLQLVEVAEHKAKHLAGYNGKWKTFLDGIDFADKISSRQKILDFLRSPEIWNYFNSWK
ncbi:MAG: HINT domain-containing protein, partial [Firmicutes bacterium]|nr:HINT domain-containing protein [Bacillota bacterium]